ncbi:hypothetical protein BH09BAC6_BH09BAC6_31640 [soil metagenome]|jgi:hypothetical protein
MKCKLFIASAGTYQLSTAFNTASAMTKDLPVAQNRDGAGEIFLVSIILILLLLALWILKNSYLLRENVNTKEIDGKEWLDNHIRDMEPDQLQTLINRCNKQQ